MKAKKEFSKMSRMILQYMNNFNTEKKASVFGSLFTVYINDGMSEEVLRKFASLIDKMNYDDLKRFVATDGDFDWLHAHDYIANGLAMFEVPKIETLADIGVKEGVDQTGASYGINPWGAEVLKFLKPFFTNPNFDS